MQTITQETQAANPADVVRALPRHVIGFSTDILTAMDLGALSASLRSLSEASAFHLDTLEELRPEPTSTARSVRVEFSLSAPNGTTGDAQIFDLLRKISARHRWNTVTKRLAH
ncbi:MAG: hypothetical protein AAGJ94_02985 [Pseudomonadota bacterium]